MTEWPTLVDVFFGGMAGGAIGFMIGHRFGVRDGRLQEQGKELDKKYMAMLRSIRRS